MNGRRRLRTRNRLTHDGLSSTREEAIRRHRGQASAAARWFDRLTATEKAARLKFMDSL